MFTVANPEFRLSNESIRALVKLLLEAEISPNNDGEKGPTTTVITIETRRAGDKSVDTPYLTVAEAAAYCRRAPKTILNHHCLGHIRSMPGTRPPLFRREDLDQWLSTRRKSRKK